MNDNPQIIQQLLELSHKLGNPEEKWAILGEGNTSTRVSDDTFLVKASGSNLATLTADRVCEVRFAPVLEALHSTRNYSDTQVKDLLLSSCVDSKSGLMPSVETLFHAYLLSVEGVSFVGHTHVTSINGIVCSPTGWEVMLGGGRMFPDEIVVCGVAPCCVGYVDPGIPLARAIRDAVERFIDLHGTRPKSIYMQNHGFTALGKSADEVDAIHQMADKAAHILTGAFAFGGPSFLTPENVARIYSRPDEHYRQKALGLKEDRPSV